MSKRLIESQKREQREADALRANLRRRKIWQQQRGELAQKRVVQEEKKKEE